MTEEYVVPAPRTPERLLELADRLKVVVERLRLFPVGAPKETDLAHECIRLGILARGLARVWKADLARCGEVPIAPEGHLGKLRAELWKMCGRTRSGGRHWVELHDHAEAVAAEMDELREELAEARRLIDELRPRS